MAFGKNNQTTKILNDLAHLEHSPLLSSNSEAAAFLERLEYGHGQFKDVFLQNMDALMRISSLDLQLRDGTERLEAISRSVADSTRSIHHASNETSDVASAVSNQHEELTNTIITASEESNNVYKKIEDGQAELTQIKELSQDTIQASEEMKRDMDQLSDVINRMNEVIEGINAISSQTNLLSLNASIEAARAGEAGRGFAVVADEIRDLANETQNLTQNMGKFVEGVKEASNRSVTSASNTITALETMTDKIGNVWKLNEENQHHVAEITNNISSLAAVSEEISSSMIELESQAAEIQSQCQTLSEDAEQFRNIGIEIKNTIKPIESIENSLDTTAKIMGHLAEDPLFALDRQDFVNYFDQVIVAHKNWLDNLGNIVSSRVILPLQLDDTKCGFGHFYNAVTPQFPQIQTLWTQVGPKHKKFHNYGSQVIRAMFDEDYAQADRLYQEAVQHSKELIHDMESIRNSL